jgi:hypothetical protein
MTEFSLYHISSIFLHIYKLAKSIFKPHNMMKETLTVCLNYTNLWLVEFEASQIIKIYSFLIAGLASILSIEAI